MSISELLLPEFDEEMKKTRATLERVPADKPEFAPHPKSMPLGKLAPHVAQLAGFGLSVLTAPELDFSAGSYKPLPLESAAQLVSVMDEGAAKVRSALIALPDEAWKQNWKLLFSGKPLFEGSRFLAYREMFLNHIVHHRAQLGVYLRLNGQPVPAIYGPSAVSQAQKRGMSSFRPAGPFYPAPSLPPKERCTYIIDIFRRSINQVKA